MSYSVSTDVIGPKHASMLTLTGVSITHATTSFTMAVDSGTQDPATMNFHLTIYTNGTTPELAVLVCDGLGPFVGSGAPVHIPASAYPRYLPMPPVNILCPISVINSSSRTDGIVYFSSLEMTIYSHDGANFINEELCRIYGFTLRYPCQ